MGRHRRRGGMLSAALAATLVLTAQTAQGAAPVAITSPAEGSSHSWNYTGPLTVDFTGGDLGAYTMAIVGPAGYSWDVPWSFDGSQTTGSWRFTPAFRAGSYTATVQAPDATTAATTSFSIAPAVVESKTGVAAFYPLERDGYRDFVRFSFRTNAPADATVRVVNSLGRAIRIVRLGELAASTTHTWIWRGRKNDGTRVNPGVFRIHVSARLESRTLRGSDVPVRVRARPPHILRASVSPSPFFPLERDGYRDTAAVRFATNVHASDTIRVRGPGGRIVRVAALGSLKGRGHIHLWRWDGRRASGAMARPGTYLVKVVAVYYGQKAVSPWRRLVLRQRHASGGGGGSCTPGYRPCLVYHGGADYDCFGGSGNGPYYTKPGQEYSVTGSDPYGLDGDGDGIGCEQ